MKVLDRNFYIRCLHTGIMMDSGAYPPKIIELKKALADAKPQLSEKQYYILDTIIDNLQIYSYINMRKKKVKYEDIKENVANVWLLDGEYYLLDLPSWRKILAHSSIDKLRYVNDIFDCDDFAWLFSALMNSLHGLNSVGFATGWLNNNEYHAFNIIMLENNGIEFWLYEPQNGGFAKVEGKRVWVEGNVYDIETVMYG